MRARQNHSGERWSEPSVLLEVNEHDICALDGVAHINRRHCMRHGISHPRVEVQT